MDVSSKFSYYDILGRLIPGSALLMSLLLVDSIRDGLPMNTQGAGALVLDVTFVVIFGFIIGTFLQILGTLLFRNFYLKRPSMAGKGSTQRGFWEKTIARTCSFLFYKDKLTDMQTRDVPNRLRQGYNHLLHLGFSTNEKEGRYCREKVALTNVTVSYLESVLSDSSLARQDTLLSVAGLLRSMTAFTVIETGYITALVYHHCHGHNRLALTLLSLTAGTICVWLCAYGHSYAHNIKVERRDMRALIELQKAGAFTKRKPRK